MPGVNFDRAAAFYDATRALPDGVAEQVRDAVLDRVGARPGTRFLEVGVGTGRIALPFVRAGHAYCGVDLSAAMLGALREKLIAGPAQPGLACADAMALPFRPGVFDVVLLIHVIHLVDDHLQTLAEVRRVLRPNGRVIISANEYTEQERRDAAERARADGRAARHQPVEHDLDRAWNGSASAPAGSVDLRRGLDGRPGAARRIGRTGGAGPVPGPRADGARGGRGAPRPDLQQ